MEKLLPRSHLPLQRDLAPLIGEKGNEDSFPINKPSAVTQQRSDTAEERLMEAVAEPVHGTADGDAPQTPGGPVSGGRLFVFRDPPVLCGRVDAPERKRKKNFLNLKKGSVAPANLP